ncbi:hypothetical protein A3F07_01530 [candidate division WWE3 bacterium RIFCSPHIGHO2_12_FULL_38_15]|uniref:RNase H type-1 domain-containing protein n=1 Tax=candidate division WWE3 bacterium RIFCSPHIGHO2_02_FULL_38_14 TaxID=1802620 RepID=A0A1F4V8Z3_UNCKA|nr:MAG: hypothetical protein A2793_01770 [candidate division WWE3 bacterium RIFCSPHIGHO2_01_FULL_38_45]OGC48386.1 MAG: hypothetical protein A3F07_01530 [candidate division WWE3 bacterium RIFCSPHIGHO2_12_FULL_38_15]OGC53637.1 MAG: hypothetical protein A3D91_04325 [candidate division WWE3 bacterium RIFCSPHIGHO2_02_FULL_38_14]OGC54320.1 MAG: hypothetical protein A3B64_02325 [candidate division WWE3 bacterium RIFCSPLOWO2_01_FULL_37_24]HLB51564.1 ribonuclease HI family protein [Patescibacteria group
MSSEIKKAILFTDGGARGNPGPGAIAAVLKDYKNKLIKKDGRYVGTSTNNEAEYQALILGMELAAAENIKSLICKMDSELVVNQLNGLYKVKAAGIMGFVKKVREMEKDFDELIYKHIPRAENHEADSLVNEILDSSLSK